MVHRWTQIAGQRTYAPICPHCGAVDYDLALLESEIETLYFECIPAPVAAALQKGAVALSDLDLLIELLEAISHAGKAEPETAQ
jgi:hypothetical protein